MPLFSSNLPKYTGPFPVGTVDVESPVEIRNINNAKFQDGKPAFEVSSTKYNHCEQSFHRLPRIIVDMNLPFDLRSKQYYSAYTTQP